jgi:O-antigen/teichoic acid export membrane protein
MLYLYHIETKYNFFSISKNIKKKELRDSFFEYIEFPKIVLWSEFLLIFIQQAPITILASIYNKNVVGYFSLVFRVFRIPTMVVGNAIGNILKNEATELYRTNGEFVKLHKRIVSILAVIGFFIYATIGISAPWMFEIALGSNWIEAGYMAQIMSPLFYFDFISWPLLSIYIVTQSYKLNFSIHLITALTITFSIYFGYFLFKNVYTSIKLFEIAIIISSLGHILFTYILAKGKTNSLQIAEK